MQGKEPVNVKKAFSCIAIIQLFALVGRNSWLALKRSLLVKRYRSVTSISLAEEEKNCFANLYFGQRHLLPSNCN
jgi:hypothetical protein